ncbi:peptidase T [Roseiconus nitratireducens]|uniref:Peptidase T n=1 Tax=Roseiconus nitratireducens TaxID=2605748 RepID=A0A5M6D6A7_9BACT|nr:peptidase T [Roseiconus nitratireducens]KAA5542100.1 peptidase T [Roseiconus nitratireducens]
MIEINRQRLLERFLRYVRVGTSADPDSQCYPSTESQRALGRLLADELVAMSAVDVRQDEHALVYATVPSTNGAGKSGAGNTPTVALVAHMDTSPEAPGDPVRPQVVENYAGGDIPLANGDRIRVDACPALKDLVGATLITTDGTTLLGGDDKAGVAIIMELAETLLENPHLAHGDVKVVMTCDEEIGRGTDKIDLESLDAAVAYTVDGGGAGVIDVETFSADAATVRVIGDNIHPSIAKGRMVNAVRAAADFVAALPRTSDSPETTEGREGFLHPYSISGGVGEATVKLLLRSFEVSGLEHYAEVIRNAAAEVESAVPGVKFEIVIDRQYRNLRDGLSKLPESVTLAEQAFQNLGTPCVKEIIRGGTDGSALTEKGLPTPNLSSGQHNIHSVREFACLDQMVTATEHLVELLSLWSNQRT